VYVFLGLDNRSGRRARRVFHGAKPASRHGLHVSRSRSKLTRSKSSESRHVAYQNQR